MLKPAHHPHHLLQDLTSAPKFGSCHLRELRDLELMQLAVTLKAHSSFSSFSEEP